MKQVLEFKRKNRIDNEAGFSLPEVMIAMAIVSIGLLSIASVQTSSVNGNSTARMTSQAATYAVDQMERLLQLNYAALLTSGTSSPRQVDGYTISWTIQVNPGGTPNISRIIVTVSSGSPNMAGKDVTITSIKALSI